MMDASISSQKRMLLIRGKLIKEQLEAKTPPKLSETDPSMHGFAMSAYRNARRALTNELEVILKKLEKLTA